ncbi:MAG: DNA gyrase subunit A [Planctomycetes bacterium]|nr:DNA gyrase subunit A [Planctomycetota bacterium]
MLAMFDAEHISDLPIEEEMRESYLTYAMSTIMDRALPDVRDGLKPSQRRVLVAMNDLNLGPRSKHRKCAKIAGDTSGNYHPHGEGVVYPTLVRMGQHWNTRYPLVDPQGNFGSLDGDPPAAMRYTEARMHAVTPEMLADLNLDTVDTQPNYDDTRTEPMVLPSKFPNLLVNGSQGIAVGMATSIPPHNLNEVCDALIHMITNPDATVRDVMEFIQGPDFPTGGIICGRKGILEGYTTGRGRLCVRATMHTEQLRGGKEQIVITEIPYQVLKSTIIERIANVVRDGRVPDIADVQDHSDRTGMRIVVDVKKGAEPQVVINQLYQYTPLQSTFSIINIALVNSAPQTLSIRDMLFHFLEHRKDVIRRRTMFLLRRARQRAHILEGLILAVADIDRIIDLIKSSPDVPTAKERLMALKLTLTEDATIRKLLPDSFVARASSPQTLTGVQAEQILAMQLRRLTGLEIEKLAKDYVDLRTEIEGYEAILRDENVLLDCIREDIYEIKDRYGDARRTEIVDDAADLDMEDLIAEEDVVVTLTHEGYVKRTPVTTYRRQGRGGSGIKGNESKEGDFIEELFIASTHDYMLVFLDSGRMHWLKVYDIPSMARTSRGRAIVNLLEMGATERICAVVAVREFDQNRFLVTATKNGLVKKTPLEAYSNVRKGGIIATGINDDDRVIGVAITGSSDEIVLGTRNGMAIRFSEDDVRSMGRTACGVKGINLGDDDEVVDMVIVDSQSTLLTVCEKGYGKRTAIDEYRLQGRGGKGIINIKGIDRNGRIVALKSVHDSDEVMLITQGGQIVRIGVDDIRTIGRATQGVRIITLRKDDELVAVAKVINEDEDAPKLPLDGKTRTGKTPAENDDESSDADADKVDEAAASTDRPADESDGGDARLDRTRTVRNEPACFACVGCEIRGWLSTDQPTG